ncbi:MAG: molybdate ABC transporter substrate-binding protein [Actinomycetota bacterium]|nr:molybdate ABC transporter substrate-binding protein [Actinomycetota bacterium]
MRRLAILLSATLALAGCGSGAAKAKSDQITVLAASSLTEAFTTLAHEYERAHPGVRVRLVFGASSSLARQVTAGAPADVIATASMSTIKGLSGVGKPAVFAHNRLAIAVPPGNPGNVHGLADLGRPALRVAVCAPQVPCGDAARRAFAAAHITGRPDTYEQDVKAVLAKVELGEVDAGLVYRTDIQAAGRRVIGLPVDPPVVAAYPILALRAAGSGFVAFVRSGRGRAVLAAAGFDPP